MASVQAVSIAVWNVGLDSQRWSRPVLWQDQVELTATPGELHWQPDCQFDRAGLARQPETGCQLDCEWQILVPWHPGLPVAVRETVATKLPPRPAELLGAAGRKIRVPHAARGGAHHFLRRFARVWQVSNWRRPATRPPPAFSNATEYLPPAGQSWAFVSTRDGGVAGPKGAPLGMPRHPAPALHAVETTRTGTRLLLRLPPVPVGQSACLLVPSKSGARSRSNCETPPASASTFATASSGAGYAIRQSRGSRRVRIDKRNSFVQKRETWNRPKKRRGPATSTSRVFYRKTVLRRSRPTWVFYGKTPPPHALSCAPFYRKTPCPRMSK